jgi:hypothetical protein
VPTATATVPPSPVSYVALAPFSVNPAQPAKQGDGLYDTTLTIPATLEPGTHAAVLVAAGDTTHTLSVNVTEAPARAVAAVLLGLGVAYLASYWFSSVRPHFQLRQAAWQLLADLLRDASTRGNVDADGQTEFSIEGYARSAIGDAAPRARDSVLALIDAGNLTAAQDRLDQLTAFGARFDAVMDSIRALRARHDEVAARLGPTSELLRRAEQSFFEHAEPVAINEAALEALATQVVEYAKAYTTILAMYERQPTVQQQLDALFAAIPEDPDDPRWRRLTHAAGDFSGAFELLDLAEEPTHVARAHNQFRAARAIITDLYASLARWQAAAGGRVIVVQRGTIAAGHAPPSVTGTVTELVVRLVQGVMQVVSRWRGIGLSLPIVVVLLVVMLWGYQRGYLGAAAGLVLLYAIVDRHGVYTARLWRWLSGTVARFRDWYAAAATRAARIQIGLALANWAFLMLGVLVATVSAMQVLYEGKSFGGWVDYLSAFLWGVGVDQTLRGLTAVFAKLNLPVPVGLLGAWAKPAEPDGKSEAT